MTHLPAVGDIPWTDADALRDYIEARPNAVTPLMLERLLVHHGLECVGDAPSKGQDRVTIWMPKDRERLRNAAAFTFLVYHSEFAVSERVVRALNMLQGLARARRLA